MKRVLGIVGLVSITVAAGCNGGSNITDTVLSEGEPTTIGTDETIESEQPDELGDASAPSETIGTSIPSTLIDQFSGATFVSAEPVGLTDIGQIPSHGIVSFTADTVTWKHLDTLSVGSYGFGESSDRVADFSGNEINFDGDGNDLTWDSQSYYRTNSALFDSQETLKAQFNGTRYISVEDFSIGETASGDMVTGKWSVQFEGDQLQLATQDTIAVGTYTYKDNRSFNIAFGSNGFTGYALSDDRLLVNSVVYEKDFSNLFDSQESLVRFLNGTSYKSSGLQTVGSVVDGAVAVGYWFIDFTENTFVWSSQDGDEAGVVEYLVDNSFKAIIADREYIIEMQGDDILWDGVRYIKE